MYCIAVPQQKQMFKKNSHIGLSVVKLQSTMGLLLKEKNKIPMLLQKKELDQVHFNHIGMEKTKDYFWHPSQITGST